MAGNNYYVLSFLPRPGTLGAAPPLSCMALLDLLGARDRAIIVYQKVVDMGISPQRIVRDDQFGLSYSPSVYAAERMTTPFVRVENKRSD